MLESIKYEFESNNSNKWKNFKSARENITKSYSSKSLAKKMAQVIKKWQKDNTNKIL